MNIIATTILAGTFMAVPSLQVSLADILPQNPLDGVSISAAGLGLEIDADGVRAEPAKAQDFKIQIRFKSGTPIEVSL